MPKDNIITHIAHNLYLQYTFQGTNYQKWVKIIETNYVNMFVC